MHASRHGSVTNGSASEVTCRRRLAPRAPRAMACRQGAPARHAAVGAAAARSAALITAGALSGCAPQPRPQPRAACLHCAPPVHPRAGQSRREQGRAGESRRGRPIAAASALLGRRPAAGRRCRSGSETNPRPPHPVLHNRGTAVPGYTVCTAVYRHLGVPPRCHGARGDNVLQHVQLGPRPAACRLMTSAICPSATSRL